MMRTLRLIGGMLLVLMSLSMAQADLWQNTQAQQNRDALGVVLLADLPGEARETLRAIKQGGPFEYDRDGVVFGNRERILPKQPRGYYHEYTVKTPGVAHRGTRRIVCGIVSECYYSNDHYQTFARIKE